jgi:hypothetical protein
MRGGAKVKQVIEGALEEMDWQTTRQSDWQCQGEFILELTAMFGKSVLIGKETPNCQLRGNK